MPSLSNRTPWFIGVLAVGLLAVGGGQTLLGRLAAKTTDLIITEVDAVRGAPGNYTFSATVVNRGTGRAIQNLVGLTVESAGSQTKAAPQRIGQLSPGNSAAVSWFNAGAVNVFTWKAVPGSHTMTVCADAEDEVQESHEDNNCLTEEFIVR